MNATLRLICPAFTFMLTVATSVAAETIFSDTFESGTPGGKGYYHTSADLSEPQLSTITTSGEDLVYTIHRRDSSLPDSTETLFKQFDLTSVGVGETLQLRAVLTDYNNRGTSSRSALRFGLAEMPALSAGDYLLDDDGAWTSGTRQGYFGVFAVENPGGSENPGASWQANRDAERIADLNAQPGNASTTFVVPDGVQNNTFIMNITRLSGASVEISGSFGETMFNSVIFDEPGEVFTDFNTVLFSIQQTQSNRRLAFSEISLQIIPEPSTVAWSVGLSVFALTVLLRRRR